MARHRAHRRLGRQAVRHSKGQKRQQLSFWQRSGTAIALLCWTLFSYFAANIVIAAIITALDMINILAIVDQTVLTTVGTAAVYVVTLAFAAGIPFLLWKYKTTWQELGLARRLPRWRDIGIAPVAFFAYLIVTSFAINILANTVPAFDAQQVQDLPFEHLTQRYEMILAYLALTIIAPIAEEIIFRGYLFGKMRKYVSRWVTILATALLFGSLHLIGGSFDLSELQWNVMVDTTIFGIALGILREYTGGIWASILLHMIKNMLAFYLTFVVPMLGFGAGGGM